MNVMGWSLLVWLGTVSAAGLYLGAVRRQRHRGRKWSRWRTGAFLTGSALAAAAAWPPLVAWAHHDPRGHMIQHLLLGMFAPLGLVLSAPATLTLRAVSAPVARRAAALAHSAPLRFASHPVSALMLDTGALYMLYLTPLYAAAQSGALLHTLLQLHFLAAGCLFVHAVAGPDVSRGSIAFRTRVIVLFAAVAAHSTLAKVMYAYGWPRGTHADLQHIQDAARIMYYGGDVAELVLAIVLFASWYRPAGRPRRPSVARAFVIRSERRGKGGVLPAASRLTVQRVEQPRSVNGRCQPCSSARRSWHRR